MKYVVQIVLFSLGLSVVLNTAEARAGTYTFTYSDTAGDAAYGQLTVQAGIGDSLWATGGTMDVTASSRGFYGDGKYDLETSSGNTLIGPGSLTHQGTNAYVDTQFGSGDNLIFPSNDANNYAAGGIGNPPTGPGTCQGL